MLNASNLCVVANFRILFIKAIIKTMTEYALAL